MGEYMLTDHAHGPLVSVIIPTFNRVSLLRRAIESVQCQTYHHFELLVVDDHSSDNTEEYVLDCAGRDGRMWYIRNPGAQGISASRNCGIDRCKGEFIAFLDSDDLWLPDHLAKAVALFLREPSVSLYFGNRIQFYLFSGLEIGTYFPADWLLQKVPHTPVGNDCYLLEREFLELFFTGNPIPTPSAVLRRGALCDVRFDERMELAEDRDFWVRLCLNERVKVAFRNRVVTRISRHDDNASAHTAEARLRLLQSHFVLYNKLCSDSRLTEWQRKKVCLQHRLERALLPYSLRHAGQFGGALRSALSNWRIVPLRITALELGKTIVCCVLSSIRRSGEFAHRRARKMT
jgi:glycosyltransferase involved in cell wall biosynthesis